MIEFIPARHDDVDFLRLVQRIANGAVATLEVHDVFLVHIDNWFDYKWLGWWSRKDQELRIPTFTPHRVQSEKRLLCDVDRLAWTSVDLPRPLHRRQPGRPSLAQPLSRFSGNAAFIWYSGSTATNTIGCMMFYLSGIEGYAWYVSMKKSDRWAVANEAQITRRQIRDFEER